MIIIYTADVERRQTKPVLDIGGIRMNLTEAFLIDLDSAKIYENIDDKLNSGSSLDDEELMELIIYPLTFKGKQAKQDAIEQVVEMLDRIEDDDTRRFVAKYLLTFTDKVINRENADKLRRILMLTKVEQIIENEKIEAVNKAVTRAVDDTRKEARKEMERVVEKLLRKGSDVSMVSECTGFSIEDVQRIQESILQEA